MPDDLFQDSESLSEIFSIKNLTKLPALANTEGAKVVAFTTAGKGKIGTAEFRHPSTGNLVWVDAVNGDDLTGSRERVDLPFSTLTAAKAAATAGDCIHVLPGTYNESNLLKNGVNWYFHQGASVVYSGSGDSAIFDDSSSGASGAVVCTIAGLGVFSRQGGGSHRDVFYISNAGSSVLAKFHGILSIGRGSITYAGALVLEGDYAITVDGTLDTVGGTLHAKFRVIESTASYTIENDGGDFFLVCDEVLGAFDSVVYNGAGNVHLRARRIHNSDYGYAVQSSGTGLINIEADTISANEEAAIGVGDSQIVLRNARILGGPNAPAVYVGASNLSLNNCTLIAGASSTNSISGTGAVKVYGSFGNKAVAGTITQQVGSVLVDVDVT